MKKIIFEVDPDEQNTLRRAFGDVAGIKNFLLTEAMALLSEVAGDSEVITIEENTGGATQILN